MQEACTQFIIVYTTFPDAQSADKVARSLLRSGFAACCNIIPQIKSMYLWNGEIAEDTEVIMLTKTKSKHFRNVENTILRYHPYDTPCIIELTVGRIAPEFADWMNAICSPV